MRQRVATRWIVLFGLLIIAFIATVTTLNFTIYSASGFVSSYLHALARHDVEGALGLPGVSDNGGSDAARGSAELLSPGSLGELTDIHLISDSDDGAGQHTVSFAYSIAETSGTSSFTVRHTGARLGVFSDWTFVNSPLATVAITPRHAATFNANGIDFAPTTGADVAHDYRVLAPAAVVLSHTSLYLTAAKTTVLIDTGGSTVAADVDVQANAVFVAAVSKELNRYLASCVTQKVLLPTGCPMGKQVTDRLQDDPTWTMVTYPIATVVPGDRVGTWQMPATQATAHLVVKIRSIFDGSLSTLSQDVPFMVRYQISFASDGTPTITAQY